MLPNRSETAEIIVEVMDFIRFRKIDKVHSIVSSKITVNSVNPTIVLTELGKRGWSDPVKKGKALERIPVGRLAGL